jgi:hypothetical protein
MTRLAAALLFAALPAVTSLALDLTNAAAPENGARVSIECGKDVHRNASTPPESACDGNAHSRCVVTGVPYTLVIELLDKLPVEKLAFAHSDYATEEAPKELAIEFDDGTKLQHTLEHKPTSGRKPAWQELALPEPKQAQKIRVTVVSNYPGGVKWGGMGDIAVLTRADLKRALAIPDHDPAAPAFVHAAKPAALHKAVEVSLPPRVKPGEHPCLLIGKSELDEFKALLEKTERGKAALSALLDVAEPLVKRTFEFPDPQGPQAQVKDRGDAPAKAHDALSKACGTLGRAYLFTGKAVYAQKAREILLGYAERYEKYPEHRGVNKNDSSKVMAQRLSEAMWLTPMIEAFDSTYDSGALTDADKKAIESGLIRPCLKMIHRKDPKELAAGLDKSAPGWRTAVPSRPAKPQVVGNWTNFYNFATIAGGAALGDQDLIDLAVYDTKKNIQAGIGEDGMWGEGAVGYQMFAMQALLPALEIAARQGIDLYSFENCRLKMPLDAVFWYAYPDGSCAGINDSARSRLGGWSAMVYDFAWLRYRDPNYAYIVNEAPRQLHVTEGVYYFTRVCDKVPEPARVTAYPSVVFDTLGYAVLRDDRSFLLMDYGRHGGTHGHYDKLNLLVYAAGDELGGEPVFHRYEDALHGEWTVQTLAHNTVTVDERSQVACDGKLLCFEDAGPLKIMRAETAGAYPGVLLDRTVVFTGDALVDLYRGRSQREHVWDRTLRFQGKLRDAAEQLQKAQDPLGARGGYQHLRVAATKAADQAVSFTWETEKTQLQAAVAGAPGLTAVTALGPDKDEMVLLRQKGPRADFGAVFSVTPWGDAPQAVKWLDNGEAVAALAFEKGGDTVQIFVAHKAGAWQTGDWKSDARVLAVRAGKDGVTQVCWCGGTFVENAARGVNLKTEKAGNAFAQQKDGKLAVTSQWAP